MFFETRAETNTKYVHIHAYKYCKYVLAALQHYIGGSRLASQFQRISKITCYYYRSSDWCVRVCVYVCFVQVIKNKPFCQVKEKVSKKAKRKSSRFYILADIKLCASAYIIVMYA